MRRFVIEVESADSVDRHELWGVLGEMTGLFEVKSIEELKCNEILTILRRERDDNREGKSS
ncbi:MAG: hypothetical protein ACXQTL_06145 [Methanosarcinales archaeon]